MEICIIRFVSEESLSKGVTLCQLIKDRCRYTSRSDFATRLSKVENRLVEILLLRKMSIHKHKKRDTGIKW
uniref:Transcriptional regulator n=1 Tax=Heterorhabditis bacteriophora TaxID=37862 RepID=A0A1I7WA15_HETBA